MHTPSFPEGNRESQYGLRENGVYTRCNQREDQKSSQDGQKLRTLVVGQEWQHQSALCHRAVAPLCEPKLLSRCAASMTRAGRSRTTSGNLHKFQHWEKRIRGAYTD